MSFWSKVLGILSALYFAAIVVILFIGSDYMVYYSFIFAGVSIKVYRGLTTLATSVAGIMIFSIYMTIFRHKGIKLLRLSRIGIVDTVCIIVIGMGMVGLVSTYMIFANTIAEHFNNVANEMTKYEETMDRFSQVKQEQVPLWDSLLYVFSLCFIVPIEEEMIFRGALFGHLERKMKPVFAVFGTAIIFGLMHGISVHIGYAFACGLLLTACYYYTDSLITPVIMHTIFNIVGSGIPNLLTLEQLGIPAETANSISYYFNLVAILAMVPSVLAFALVRHNSKERRRKLNVEAEAIASGAETSKTASSDITSSEDTELPDADSIPGELTDEQA